MAQWVKCTHHNTDTEVFVNLDHVRTIVRERKAGYTEIRFSDLDDDILKVNEPPQDIVASTGPTGS
jgi:hypothetical protein